MISTCNFNLQSLWHFNIANIFLSRTFLNIYIAFLSRTIWLSKYLCVYILPFHSIKPWRDTKVQSETRVTINNTFNQLVQSIVHVLNSHTLFADTISRDRGTKSHANISDGACAKTHPVYHRVIISALLLS